MHMSMNALPAQNFVLPISKPGVNTVFSEPPMTTSDQVQFSGRRMNQILVGATLFLSGIGVGDLLNQTSFSQIAAVFGIGAAILIVAHIAPIALTHAGAWKVGKHRGEKALIAQMKDQKGFEAVLEKLKKMPFANKLTITSDPETRTITIIFHEDTTTESND